MDRNAFARAAWLAYTTRQRTPSGQRLSATGYLLARVMLRRANRAGGLWPSRCTLALDLGVSDRTVERQHAIMRALGLLTWQTRRAHRARRAPNLYCLTAPKLPERKRESICDSSGDIVSVGGVMALRRLAELCGAGASEVMPWLANMAGVAPAGVQAR
jgi:hypothetical protein